MDKKSEKSLTQKRVKKLGLDKVSVITADMLEGYTSIDYAAFSGCFDLISIEIPNSVTRIEGYAFLGCYNLTSITIPNSVTNIGHCVFSNCTALTSITIPSGVTKIKWGIFMECRSLTSVHIPNSVTSIEYRAFYNCIGLTGKLVIPDSVTIIEEEAFYNCSRLTSIVIPDSVTGIGCGAFDGCYALTSITIKGKKYKPQKVTNGKCKAYKAFRADMTCRDFQYKEGKTYKYEGEPILCEQGFHASLDLSDVFNYYYGEFGKDMVVHEVKLEGVSDERNGLDSKVVAKKIKIGKRIL